MLKDKYLFIYVHTQTVDKYEVCVYRAYVVMFVYRRDIGQG